MRFSPARSIAVLAALGAVCAAALPTASHAAPPKKGSKAPANPGTVIQQPDLGLTFTLPAGYLPLPDQQRQLIAPETQFFANGPAITRRMYATIAIAVMPSPLPEGLDLATMPPAVEDQIKQTMEAAAKRRYASYHIENAARGKVAGESAYFVAALSDVTDSDMTFRHRTCILLHNNKLYYFVFVTEQDRFPNQVPAFEKLLASIKWDAKKE